MFYPTETPFHYGTVSLFANDKSYAVIITFSTQQLVCSRDIEINLTGKLRLEAHGFQINYHIAFLRNVIEHKVWEERLSSSMRWVQFPSIV